jgi:hypothetical protein
VPAAFWPLLHCAPLVQVSLRSPGVWQRTSLPELPGPPPTPNVALAFPYPSTRSVRKAPKTQSIVRPLTISCFSATSTAAAELSTFLEAAFNLAPAERLDPVAVHKRSNDHCGGDGDYQQHSRSSISLPLARRTLCTLRRSRLCDAKNSARPCYFGRRRGMDIQAPGWPFDDGRVRQRGTRTKITASAGCKATIAAMQAK